MESEARWWRIGKGRDGRVYGGEERVGEGSNGNMRGGDRERGRS